MIQKGKKGTFFDHWHHIFGKSGALIMVDHRKKDPDQEKRFQNAHQKSKDTVDPADHGKADHPGREQPSLEPEKGKKHNQYDNYDQKRIHFSLTFSVEPSVRNV